MEALFGGSHTTDTTASQYKALRTPVASTLQQLFNPNSSLSLSLGGGGFNPSTMSVAQAPMAEGEAAALAKLRGNLDNPDVGNYLHSVLSGNYLPGQPGSNPFLDAAIQAAQRPTLQGLEETLSRTLPGRFTQAGQFVQPRGSSAFDRAAAIASRGAADALGDIATKMSYQGYDSERQRQQEAVALSQQEVSSTIENLKAQALPRLIAQNGIDQGLELFKGKVQALLDALQIAAGVSHDKGTSSTNGIIPALAGIFEPAALPFGLGAGTTK